DPYAAPAGGRSVFDAPPARQAPMERGPARAYVPAPETPRLPTPPTPPAPQRAYGPPTAPYPPVPAGAPRSGGGGRDFWGDDPGDGGRAGGGPGRARGRRAGRARGDGGDEGRGPRGGGGLPIGFGALLGVAGLACFLAALLVLPWFQAGGRDVALADMR